MEHKTRFARNYPGTYISLLPKDLRLLLSAFYYGPIEIVVKSIFTEYHEFVVNLSIDLFSSTNKLVSTITFPLSINELLKYHRYDTNDGTYGGSTREITWKSHAVYITLVATTFSDRPITSDLNLYDFQADLFWNKLTVINNKLKQFEKDHLDVTEINRRLPFTV